MCRPQTPPIQKAYRQRLKVKKKVQGKKKINEMKKRPYGVLGYGWADQKPLRIKKIFVKILRGPLRNTFSQIEIF